MFFFYLIKNIELISYEYDTNQLLFFSLSQKNSMNCNKRVRCSFMTGHDKSNYSIEIFINKNTRACTHPVKYDKVSRKKNRYYVTVARVP
jgi:hypothetical protein